MSRVLKTESVTHSGECVFLFAKQCSYSAGGGLNGVLKPFSNLISKSSLVNVKLRDLFCVNEKNPATRWYTGFLSERMVLGYQILFPFFHTRGDLTLQQGHKRQQCFTRISDGVIKGIPVLAVFAVVVGNDIIKFPGFP